MNKRKKLPIGLQSFREIIENDYLYVDKTEIIYRLVNDYKYIFLSRPRRFGKSLLINTLHEYFAGEKELFKGLAMEHLETKWTKHPVLHFGLSTCKDSKKEELIRQLGNKLSDYEKIYGSDPSRSSLNERLEYLVLKAHEKTKEKVVVLIDEYDAPLLNAMHTDFLEENRIVMRNFYSPLKDLDYHLRCVFITGITKFSQLSIFSEINNLTNVSMYDSYSAICGITQHELETQLKDYVEDMGKELGLSTDEAFNLLKDNYDGYHFSANCEDLYNPFSLLTSLKNKSILSKWFESGTPTFLINKLKNSEIPLIDLENYLTTDSVFNAPIEEMSSAIPMLYHSGYLTIKSHEDDIFCLGYPNKEVKKGLSESLFPNYLNITKEFSVSTAIKLRKAFANEDIDECMEIIRSFLSSIPYDLHEKREKSFQLALFIIFNLLGINILCEMKHATGRADAIIKTNRAIFVFEFKVDQSADVALQQIDDKGYMIPFTKDDRKLYKIGVNFSSEERTINEWRVAQ